jgi:hypothetical protein
MVEALRIEARLQRRHLQRRSAHIRARDEPQNPQRLISGAFRARSHGKPYRRYGRFLAHSVEEISWSSDTTGLDTLGVPLTIRSKQRGASRPSLPWLDASRRASATTVAFIAGCAVIGLVITRKPALAVAAVAVLVAALMPAWLLVTGALVTARGFNGLIPQAGLVSWQSVSAFLILAAVAKWMIARRSRPRMRPSRLALLIVALMTWLLVTAIALGTVFTAPLRIVPFALFPLTYCESDRGEQNMLRGVVAFALIEAALSIRQFPSRLYGVHVGDPHEMGFLLVGALALVISDTVHFKHPRWITAALLASIVATRTRGVWLATLVLLVIWILPRATGRRAVLLAAGAVVVGALLFSPLTHAFDLNPASSSIRTTSVSAGLKNAEHHPIFGEGWSSTKVSPGVPRPPANRPYDLIVFFAVVGGFPAALLALMMLIEAVHVAARRHFGALLFFGAFIAFSVSESTLYPGSLTAPLFFLFCALATVGVPNTARLARANAVR